MRKPTARYHKVMVEDTTILLPYATLFSHVIFVVLFLALVFRNSWGKESTYWLGAHSTKLVFGIVLLAVAGSLFYSEVNGFEPCVLCWWQRIFLYPLVIIFGLALWKKTRDAFSYAVPLVILSTIVSTYQAYVNLGGSSILPCTAVGGACSKVYVLAFGYITIPMMSLTISLYILLLAWANKIYENRNT